MGGAYGNSLPTSTNSEFLLELTSNYWFSENLLCARHNGSSRSEIFLLYLYPASCQNNSNNNKNQKQKPNNFLGHFLLYSFLFILWKCWDLEVEKWYHWKYSGLSYLHLGVGTANSHFLNELFLCAFTVPSTAVPCIYYTLSEDLSIDFVQACDSINILWKMKCLDTDRVRIPSRKKKTHWCSLA